MENKSDLIDLAWMVYYLTWDWCQQSEDNMAQAVELYVESCEDEGVVSNESICQRALDIFACPSPSEAVSVMTTEEEDRLSLADRPVLAAENDLLETMDFFISIGSYTEEDRTAILDKELVNSSVAERCARRLKRWAIWNNQLHICATRGCIVVPLRHAVQPPCLPNGGETCCKGEVICKMLPARAGS